MYNCKYHSILGGFCYLSQITITILNSYLVINRENRSFTEGKVVIMCSFLGETGSEETDSTFSPESKGAERLQSATESVRKILI